MLAVCAGFWCALCPDVTRLLPGTNYTGATDCQSRSFDTNLTVYGDTHIEDVAFVGAGQLTLVGSDISIVNVITSKPILLKAAVAGRNILLRNVTCMDGPAIVALGGAGEKHAPMDIDNMVLIDVNATPFAAAAAHTTGAIVCASGPHNVLLEPVASSQSDAASCTVTDLSAILGVFGKAYTLQFFDGPAKPVGVVLYITKLLVCIFLGLLLLLYLSARHTFHLLMLGYSPGKKEV